jgi:hypothetical protein
MIGHELTAMYGLITREHSLSLQVYTKLCLKQKAKLLHGKRIFNLEGRRRNCQ